MQSQGGPGAGAGPLMGRVGSWSIWMWDPESSGLVPAHGLVGMGPRASSSGTQGVSWTGASPLFGRARSLGGWLQGLEGPRTAANQLVVR